MKQCWYNVVSTLCNIFSTLFRRRVLTLYQLCATLKNPRRILFQFQRRINVISTLIHNVEIDPALKCWLWNSCSALPVKKLVNTFQGRVYSNISVVNISNKSGGDHNQKTSRRNKLISTFYSTHPPQKCHANAISDTVM